VVGSGGSGLATVASHRAVCLPIFRYLSDSHPSSTTPLSGCARCRFGHVIVLYLYPVDDPALRLLSKHAHDAASGEEALSSFSRESLFRTVEEQRDKKRSIQPLMTRK